MKKAITLGIWQLVVVLNCLEPQRTPDLKLPTEDELRAMAKVVYRKFGEAKKMVCHR